LRATLDADTRNFFSALTFSPDGRTLASTGGRGPTIKLWDVATGDITATLQWHEGGGQSVAFSPDGETLASGGGRAITLWDMRTRKEKATFKGNSVGSVAFSPDGKTLASASDDGITLWDLASGKSTATLEKGGNRSVAFSPDGKTLASARSDGSVQLWDLASGKQDPVFEWVIGPWGSASSVAFSPDGTALAAGGVTEMMSLAIGSGRIMLWDPASRKEKTSFRCDSQNIESIAFSPDGKTLATASWNGKVQLWDTSTGKLKARVGHVGELQCVAISPDGRILAAAGYKEILLWDMPKAR
jgi:WD40 repeat protein